MSFVGSGGISAFYLMVLLELSHTVPWLANPKEADGMEKL